jgi:hypothetical protein
VFIIFSVSDVIVVPDPTGEGAIDGGGVFRESLSALSEELHSPTTNVGLLIPNEGSFILNPRFVTQRGASTVLRVIGILMAAALRSGAFYPIRLPEFVWRRLVGLPAGLELTESTNPRLFAYRSAVKDYVGRGGGREAFSDVFVDATFSFIDVVGEVVELVGRGASVPLTFDNAAQFVAAAEQRLLSELEETALWLGEGFGSIVPVPPLRMWSSAELAMAVCGREEFDVELLARHTQYVGYAEDSAPVRLFWRVFRGLTEGEKSAFLRFAWGRLRLPLTDAEFDVKFTLQKMTGMGGGGDDELPKSHTCSFEVDWPPYTNEAIARER